MQYGDLVSVIIPTYNRERSIRRAIDGVLAQTYRNLELIVVDDGSTDRTIEIIEAMEDPRLRLIRQPVNGGAGHARHTGVLAATADLIAFQDSDDAWLPDKLETQVAELIRCGESYVAVFSPEIIYGRDGTGSNKRYGPRRVACVPGPDTKLVSGDMASAFLHGNHATLQTILMRKSAYLDAGGFDLGLRNNEDWDFNIRLSRVGNMAILDLPQVIVNDSPDGISKNRQASHRSLVRIFCKIKRLEPSSAALGEHALTVSRQLMLYGRPRASRRFLRYAMAARPGKAQYYLRYALSYFPGIYNRLIQKRRAAMNVSQS